MRSSKAVATASLCVVLLGGAACGGQGKQSEDEIVADVAEALQKGDKDLDDKEAKCFAEIVVDVMRVDEARDIKPTEKDPSAKQQEAIAKAAIRAQDECDLGDEG